MRLSAVNTMLAAAYHSFPNETGGVLMGYLRDNTVEATHVIGAGPLAREHPRSFTPDRDWQYRRIDELFEESGGSIRYLGDWHTHPRGTLHLSALDRLLLHDTARDSAAQCPEPIMCILAGGEGGVWQTQFFRYSAGLIPWRRLHELRHEFFDGRDDQSKLLGSISSASANL